MHAELHVISGLILTHVVWFLAYLTGTLIDRREDAPETAAAALAEFVVRSASGLALSGFATFFIGVAGWLNPIGFAGLFACFVIALRMRHGRELFTGAAWRALAQRVGRAFNVPTLLLYYAALAAIVPAVLPDTLSDSVRYHLAYPVDWAVHGRIYPDYFLRLPFYPTNFQLLFAAFQTLGLAAYVHFLPWLCGALVVLATRAAVALLEERLPPPAMRVDRVARTLVTVLLPLSILVSPIFLRWVDTAYIDVPAELFAFVPTLCLVLALVAKRDLRWSAVCCGAFFVGIKVSFIVFIPMLVAFVWILTKALGENRRARAVACLVFLAASSPWYARSFIYDHDPIAPVVNIALHHRDATYDRYDYVHNNEDLSTDRSPAALAMLPLNFWLRTDVGNQHEFGNVGLIVLLYVPFAALGAAMMFGVRTPLQRAVVVFSAASAYGLAYCVATSYLLRYTLIFQPALAASVASILLVLPRRPAVAWLCAATAALAVVPSRSAMPWYAGVFRDYYRNLELEYKSDDGYVARYLPGYSQVQEVFESGALSKQPPPRVLLIRIEAEYYFRRRGVETVGDWFGPGRYRDLVMMMENGRLRDYVRHFDIGAVIVQRHQGGLSDAQVAELRQGLTALGFRTLEDTPGYYVAVR